MSDTTAPDGSGTEQLLLRGGLLFDGTGSTPKIGDLRIGAGRILERGDHLPRNGAIPIELAGQCVAPGFIDVHSHSDLTVLANPGLESKLTQGVTTEVVGNCGGSPFPVSPDNAAALRSYIDSFYPGVTRRSAWDWTGLAEWATRVAAARPGTNLVPLVGHASLRIAVAGFHNRPLSPGEQEVAANKLETALREGAFGLSTGLAYAPELATRAEDLAPLLSLVARYGGIYATHQRDEGKRVVDSVRESLTSAQVAGVRLEISHIKCLGRAQWGGAPRLLADIARAREGGTAVRADFYPYRAAETSLTAFLPGWVFEGAWTDTERRLRDPRERARVRAEVAHGVEGWTIAPDHLSWEDVVISLVATAGSRRYLGRTVAEIASEARQDPVEFVLDLLATEHGAVSILVFGVGEADVAAIGNDPDVLVGSDGVGNSITDGPLFGPIHPRNYGCFPRFLATQPAEGLAQAIRRITALPCEHFRIPFRGLLATGGVADMVTWNSRQAEVGPTYGEPARYSRMFDSVWVGGVPAVWNGTLTGLRGGRVLLRPLAGIG